MGTEALAGKGEGGVGREEGRMAGAGDGTAGSPATLDVNLLSPGTSSAAKPGRWGGGGGNDKVSDPSGQSGPQRERPEHTKP